MDLLCDRLGRRRAVDRDVPRGKAPRELAVGVGDPGAEAVALTLDPVEDSPNSRSGRGDTCVGSYASRRLAADPADATRWAAAVTSLKLEAEGPIRRSRADVERLLQERY